MTATILRGDAAHLPIPDASVDLVVTSPPYFGLRSYTDGGEHYEGQVGDEATPAEYLDALTRCTAEWMRVLKPDGSIFVNLGDKYAGSAPGRRDADTRNAWHEKNGLASKPYKAHDGGGAVPGWTDRSGFRPKSLIGLPWRYAIRCIDDLGLVLRAEIVWAKPNGLPESVTDRVRRSHEQVFHFTKSPRYFSAVDEVREAHKPGQSAAALSFNRPGRETAPGQSFAPHRVGREDQGLNPLGKLPGSVWTIATAPLTVPEHLGVDHFAAYPPELVRRIVLGWSPVGGTVVDPFGGTGTTALVADVHGRHGISVDLSADYCRLARWRTTDPAERARVLGVPKPPQQVTGQLGMFEGIGA